RPALIAWARSRTSRSWARSRSARSMKSRPSSDLTGAIMIACPGLKSRLDKFSSHDRRDRQVAEGIEFRQPDAELRIVAQLEDQIPAGGGLEAEEGWLEAEGRFILELDSQVVRELHAGPGAGLGQGH